MFIFNTTFAVVDVSIQEWKNWMDRNYLPTFKDILPQARIELYKVLAIVQEGTTNFSCQIKCESPNELEVLNKYSSVLLDDLKNRFGENCLSFSTILQEEN